MRKLTTGQSEDYIQDLCWIIDTQKTIIDR